MPFVGAPKLVVDGTDVVTVFNDHGNPRTTRISWKSPAPTKTAPPIGTNAPACAAAVGRVYCAASQYVYNASIRGGARATTTSTRSRGAVAAAAIGAGGVHALVAWLEQHASTEGLRHVAMGRVDDGEPFQISEEGSGATWVDIAEQGERAVVVSIDARTSMVPVHAREVRILADGKVKLEPDVVVSVGGAPGVGIRVAAGAAAKGTVFALLPDAKDAHDFGLSLIRLEEPFREESPRSWSVYPNGLDPAPVAASRRGEAIWTAFARPAAAIAARVIVEIARVDDAGGLQQVGISMPTEAPSELSVAVDPRDALWLAVGGSNEVTLERWECPTKSKPK